MGSDPAPRVAADTLGEIARLRRVARLTPGAPWFPMVCFGTLTTAGAPLVAAAGAAALMPLWLVAAPIGLLLTRRHYRRRARHLGATGRARRSWAFGLGIAIGCTAAGVAAGLTFGEAAGVVAPIVVTLAGFIVLGLLQHDLTPAALVTVAAIAATGFVVVGAPLWLAELGFGAGLVLGGLVVRAQEAPA